MRSEIKKKTKFFKIRCGKCKNEQNVFSKVATEVKCLVCGELLAKPTGGKTKFLHTAVEEI